jgi:hypothetical protein
MQVLVTLKLVQARADGLTLVVDALVAPLLPHFSEGFPDDPVPGDVVDDANWIPSVVARAVSNFCEVTGRDPS